LIDEKECVPMTRFKSITAARALACTPLPTTSRAVDNVASCTATIRRVPTEIRHKADDGPAGTCAASFDNTQPVPKANFGTPSTHRSALKVKAEARAIGFAARAIDD
jgi:hypothetical protein